MVRGVIVDGSNLLSRILYSKVGSLTTSTGVNSGLIYGFLNSLSSIKRRIPDCSYCFVIWDLGISRFRYNIYNDYKGYTTGQVVGTPSDDLRRHLYGVAREDLNNYLPTFGIPSIMLEEIEADDVIGFMSLCTNVHWTIWSEDRDMVQLLNESVDVYCPMTNVSYKYDEVLLQDEVSKDDFRDFFLIKKAICGDGDVSGISGIADVNATRISKAVISNSPLDIEKKRLDKVFIDNIEIARRNIMLMDIFYMIHTNYDMLKSLIDFYMRNLMTYRVDYVEIIKLFNKYEIKNAMLFSQNLLNLNDSTLPESYQTLFGDNVLPTTLPRLNKYIKNFGY